MSVIDRPRLTLDDNEALFTRAVPLVPDAHLWRNADTVAWLQMFGINFVALAEAGVDYDAAIIAERRWRFSGRGP